MSNNPAPEEVLRRFRYHAACLIDGFIAYARSRMDCLTPYQNRDYGFSDFMEEANFTLSFTQGHS